MAVSIEEARAAVLEHVAVLDSEEVGLDDALGRALAEDATAPNHVPPFDASAMDGYAIVSADTAGGSARLELIGEAKAGAGAGVSVRPGTAVRISTGAPVPDGADAIVPQELTTTPTRRRSRSRARSARAITCARRARTSARASSSSTPARCWDRPSSACSRR